MELIIVTNNNKVNEKYLEKYEVLFLEDKPYIEVLHEARGYIHKGFKLLTHPMSSSLKPNQTPFKTIILEKGTGGIDYDSIVLIENSIEHTNKFLRFKQTPNWSDKIREDFKTVDLSLIQPVINNPLISRV